MKHLATLILILCLSNDVWSQTVQEYFKPLKFRNIGPFRGGRSVTATGVIGDPLTYYMGTTGGGLWKTTDAGQQWSNISDGFFKTGSVGAVAVSQSNPNIVYCGMGEHAPRGVMTSYGDGVYKSNDAGKTWQKLGLDATQHIARIVIHPTNPDIVYVAAQGALYAPNSERGIYKSTDGGKTFKNVLFVNNLTGCSELVMDPTNSEIMYATMWHHQRTPNQVISGGEGSGVYKSTDAGNTWKKIESGLPKEKGKMAITVCASNPEKLYLLMESDTQKDGSGLYTSYNSGKSWSMVSGDNRLTQRAWYYIEVFADPNNENTVYVLSAPALRSEDGGKTWSRLYGTHGDFHDLWINPRNSKNMVIANDGGAAISFNYGKSWSRQDNMPTSQFYRINTDDLFPYNIYAGQQDNSSLKIASMALGSYGIDRHNWTSSAGGESAFLAFDPKNPRYVLGGSYLGTIDVVDMETKTSTNIMAAPIQYLGKEARDMKYLYNWNAPTLWDPHNKDTYYHCAQYVLKTSDFGKTWTEISPDLTRNIDAKQGKGGAPYTNEAVGAENYGTISYMIISPHEKGVFYTGSDDGLVHITKDGGKTWNNVTPKGLKNECLVNAIEVSPHDPATAYIATTRYKFNDYAPSIYKTTNYGKSWTQISNGIPNGAFTRVVREDENRKGLLYAGTEKGLYISFNDGKIWEPFQLNLPVTPITDLKVHQGDLVVATSGRSFWVLDNLNLLHQYKPSTHLKLYAPEDTMTSGWGSAMDSNGANGTNPFNGVNPASGMVIYYQLPELDKTTEVVLEIKNAKGELVRSFTSVKDTTYIPHNGGGAPPKPTLSKTKGLNRFVWDKRHDIIPGIPNVYIEAGFRGHRAIPGEYTLTLKAGENNATTKANIVKLPNVDYAKDFSEYETIMSSMEANVIDMHNKTNALYKVKNQLETLVKSLDNKDLKASGNALLKKLKAWDNKMVQRRSQAYDDVENFENKFSADYLFLLNQTDSETFKVNQPSIDLKAEMDKQWNTLKAEAEQLINQEIPAYNKALWDAGIGAVKM